MRGRFLILMLLLLSSVIAYGQVNNDAVYLTTSFSQFPSSVEPGRQVEVVIGVENKGSAVINDFQIELVENPLFTLIGDSLKTLIIQNTNKNGIISVSWDVLVSADTVEGNQDIDVRYKFNGGDWIIQTYKISVKTEDPFINLADIKTIPENAGPGEPFQLVLVTENTADSDLYNVKFKLNTDDLIPLKGTNEEFISVFNKKSEHSIIFNLITKGTADSTIYTIPLTISWKDSQNNVYSTNRTFGVIISSEPNLVSNLEDTTLYTAGNGKITLSISNIGVEEVKFITLILEDTDTTKILSSKKVYLGNIASDDFETAQFNIYSKKGPVKGILTYKDGLNKVYQQEISIPLTLYSNSEAKKLGLITSKNPTSSYISFVVIVFLLIFMVLMLIDLHTRRMVRYKKYLWTLIIILTTVFGTSLYYFMVKRKHD